MPPRSYTLRENGDCLEREGSFRFNLDIDFHRYDEFWRRHVVPTTARPNDIGLNPGTHPALARVCQLSHSIFRNVFFAAKARQKVATGDFGEEYGIFTNCEDVMRRCGDAIQLSHPFQNAIAGQLFRACGRAPENLFPDFKTNWAPRREEAVAYRNSYPHDGYCTTLFTSNPTGGRIPFVVRPDKIEEYSKLDWITQGSRMQSNPGDCCEFSTACEQVYKGTLDYLEAFYEVLINKLRPLEHSPEYLALRGTASRPIQIHFATPLSNPYAMPSLESPPTRFNRNSGEGTLDSDMDQGDMPPPKYD